MSKQIRSNDNRHMAKVDMNEFRYVPITYEECKQLFDHMKKRLVELGFSNSLVLKNGEQVIQLLERILIHAEKSSCSLILANGYYSYGKLAYKMLKCMDDELSQNNSSVEKLRNRVDCFDKISIQLLSVAQVVSQILDETNLEDAETVKKLQNESAKYPEFFSNQIIYRQIKLTKRTPINADLINNNSISSSDRNSSMNGSISGTLHNHSSDSDSLAITKNVSSTDDSFNSTPDQSEFLSLPLVSPHINTILASIFESLKQKNSKEKSVLFRELFLCWIDQDLAKFFKAYAFVLPFLRVHLYNYPRLLLSRQYRSEVLNKILNYPTVNFPSEFINLFDLKICLFFMRYFTRHTNARSEAVYIASQNTIKITKSYDERLIFNNRNQIDFDTKNTIRCKLVKPTHTDLRTYDKLILSFRGGGWFTTRADSHEIYLKHWVNYNQIPILSVDYRLKQEFPASLKDCFDVYLWLRTANGDEIRSKLGYYPTKIVVAGDSAGGNLAMGVLLILNDLRTQYKSELKFSVQMPDGLVLTYPTFLVHLSMCPSAALSTLDTLIPVAVQLMILWAITGHIPNLRPNTFLETVKSFLFPFSDPRPFFDCPDGEFEEKIRSIAKEIQSPYLKILFYDKFDQLTDIPIHLIPAEFCPLLDESITLAKLYRGNLKIDVIPDLCHGFMNAHFLSKKVHRAMLFVAQRVTEMFEQIDDKIASTNVSANQTDETSEMIKSG